ncbi:substrate-binding periplasmic protein [Aliiglaciecola litoralis]|uniref:Solute-binding protein family 3/N-terminal domain-containing protein n=1 Tax=Aliiglaciecola litoralis TaxID=582857 RepID=A0ABN1LEZ0_9ALTE
MIISVLFCSFVQAAPILQVAVGWNKPPYVMQYTKSGFEVDLVKAVFQNIGHQVEFVHIPYGRSHEILEATNFDAAMTLSDKVQTPNTFLSNEYVRYQNVAVSLLSPPLDITSIESLADYSIVAFQNAKNLLGPRFHHMAENHQAYSEVPDQIRQLKLLYYGKAQVIVMDVNIFKYFDNQLRNDISYQQTQIHPLFAASTYRVGFVDKALRDKFNSALEAYLESNDYQHLLETYQFDQTGLGIKKLPHVFNQGFE